MITCTMNNAAITARHNGIVNFLLSHINESRTPKVVCKSENNKTSSILKQDLECYIAGNRYLMIFYVSAATGGILTIAAITGSASAGITVA